MTQMDALKCDMEISDRLRERMVERSILEMKDMREFVDEIISREGSLEEADKVAIRELKTESDQGKEGNEVGQGMEKGAGGEKGPGGNDGGFLARGTPGHDSFKNLGVARDLSGLVNWDG